MVRDALDRQAAVALIGPRQVGKTTLALSIAEGTDALYLDLEAPEDRAKLADPALFLRRGDRRSRVGGGADGGDMMTERLVYGRDSDYDSVYDYVQVQVHVGET